MSTDVFLSYARTDRDTAALVASALEGVGLSVWWDAKLLPGESFDEQIQQAVAQAKVIIGLLSPNGKTYPHL